MKKTLMAMTAVALMMGVSAPAFAHDMDKKADHYMMKMDTNKDGSISKAEHTAFSDKMFTEADTNGDGMISKEELKNHKMKEKDEMKKD